MLTAQAAGSAVTMGCRHGQRATLFVVCERAGMWSLGEGGWLGIDSRARSGDLIHLTKGLWRFVTRGAAGGTRAPRSHWGRSTVYHCPVRYPQVYCPSEGYGPGSVALAHPQQRGPRALPM